jgi:HSP20 family protein
MANMPRSNPFGELLNELSDGFFIRPLARAAGLEPGIRLEVREQEEAYSVLAEIPGARKEDIHIDVDGSGVTLRAELKQESLGKQGEKVLYSDRGYGTVSRSLSLPGEVDAQGAKAAYRDGLLLLTLPKKLGGKGRRVAIS